ncbi:hypothetical protein [Chitinimonas koreensis]|uniref:hypothetical protein n=1 Tax=Chitinimonas koreensis TaxID=356302 RepID=UPI000425CA16|nr:hypothetical protein [Chitinimonas koreensis]QNM95650.1 hypothetical protein H9L41_17575 [Chitinimonas koreensis]
MPSRQSKKIKKDDAEWIPSGGRRAALIPSHGSSFTSSHARGVLKRYAANNKAKYQGAFHPNPTLTELRDVKNWSVKAKSGTNSHTWLNLGATYKTKNSGRNVRQVQLGHKLSAAEYYQKGSRNYINRRVAQKEKDYPGQGQAKRLALTTTFGNLTTPGQNLAFDDRRGVNSSFNLRFETYSFNAKHGGDGHGFG